MNRLLDGVREYVFKIKYMTLREALKCWLADLNPRKTALFSAHQVQWAQRAHYLSSVVFAPVGTLSTC